MVIDPYLIVPPFGWLIISTLALAGLDLLTRAIMKRQDDYMAVTPATDMLSMIIFLVLIIILGPSFGANSPVALDMVQPIQWLFVMISAGCYTGYLLLAFKTSIKMGAAQRTVLTQTRIVWVAILSTIFLQEIMSVEKIVGIFLIIVGSALALHLKGMSFEYSKEVLLVLLGALFLSLAAIIDKDLSHRFGPLVYGMLMFALPVIYISLMMGKSAFSRILKMYREHTQEIVLYAIAGPLTFVTLLMSYSQVDVSVAQPINSTSVVLTAICAIIFLGEKKGWVKKVAGALIALIGVVILG